MAHIVGLFDQLNDARDTIDELKRCGFADDRISFVGQYPQATHEAQFAADDCQALGETRAPAEKRAGIGAVGGTMLGGLGGLVVGLGIFAIPGIGPLIEVGSLATALGLSAVGAGIGAVAGGLVGALVSVGIPERQARIYAEAVRRGGMIVVVQTMTLKEAQRASAIMERHQVVDIEARGLEYLRTGWTGVVD